MRYDWRAWYHVKWKAGIESFRTFRAIFKSNIQEELGTKGLGNGEHQLMASAHLCINLDAWPRSHHVKSLSEHNTLEDESAGRMLFLRCIIRMYPSLQPFGSTYHITKGGRTQYKCPNLMSEQNNARFTSRQNIADNGDQQIADAISAPSTMCSYRTLLSTLASYMHAK